MFLFLIGGGLSPVLAQAPEPAAVAELWVDAGQGNDAHDGLTPATAFRTLQKAANEATPGTLIRVLPGVYRESVRPARDGTSSSPITFRAEQGPGSVIVRGSEPSGSFTWNRLAANTIGLPAHVDPTNLYYADLSAWNLSGTPRFVVLLDGAGEVSARLPLAREPDWHVTTDWRYHELWWTADGGWDVAQCDPSDPDTYWNCDLEWRCTNRLTDRSVFPEPDPRIEPGDLTTLGDLTGAELVALDSKWGHYLYRRRIVMHEVGAGRITVEGACQQDGGASDPGLGWGSKYYVEDHPALLDSPGEWWYDTDTRRLYLWPSQATNPANLPLEISRRTHGFNLTNRSHIVLDGLTVELFDESAVYQSNWITEKAHGNTLRNLTLRYANRGVEIQQYVRSGQPVENVTRNFTLEDSEIAHMDTHGLFVTPWWDGAPQPTNFPHSGIYDMVVRGNLMHHLGLRSDLDNAVGVQFQFPDRVRFEDNHVHSVAHNGVQLLWSVIQSDKSYDFSPEEIKTGEILIKDNLIERACLLTTDCGALKFWGPPPNNHVFRDVLVTGNIFRDVLGWTYVSQQRVGWWVGGEGCEVQGQAGFGLYLDYASGIHAHRNIAHNNAYAGVMLVGTWRDGDLLFTNNVIANSLYGFRLSGTYDDTHGGSVNTQLRNNIIVGNEGYGIYQCTAAGNFGNLAIDHNLYYNNGWRSYADGGVWQPGLMAIRTPQGQSYYPTLAHVQSHPAGWETHGRAADPAFQQYDPDAHSVGYGPWPDFRLTSASTQALDRGTTVLPGSLTTLLNTFGISDPRWGAAYDMGRYELGFFVSVQPPTRSIAPGETASYVLSIEAPGGLAAPLTIEAGNPDPRFDLTLSATQMDEEGEVTLTLEDRGGPADRWYTVPIVASGSGFAEQLSVQLLVGGSHVYLPLVLRNH